MGKSSLLGVHRLATVAPSPPFCCEGEADGKCGQRSCRLFSSKVFTVAASKTASVRDNNHRVHAPSLTYYFALPWPCLGSKGICAPSQQPRPSPDPPLQLQAKGNPPVGRSQHGSSPRFQSSRLIKLATRCKMGWFIPCFISGGEQAQMLLMDGKFRKRSPGNR